MNAIKTLLEKYKLADPVHVDTIGNFTNPLIAALFDTLIARGKQRRKLY